MLTLLDECLDVLREVLYGYVIECNCSGECEGTCTKARVESLERKLNEVKKKNQQTTKSK